MGAIVVSSDATKASGLLSGKEIHYVDGVVFISPPGFKILKRPLKSALRPHSLT